MEKSEGKWIRSLQFVTWGTVAFEILRKTGRSGLSVVYEEGVYKNLA